MILYVETNFLILISLICKNNKNLLINAKYLKILSVSRHFERSREITGKKSFQNYSKGCDFSTSLRSARNDEVCGVKMSLCLTKFPIYYFGLLFDVFL